ncbi:hypothetical protein [Paraburkholderia sp. CI3]|uniref:hypothetical protein n=1 Tax=Paraburkholderia sp. CI3 TaxID=2991060 RepID=UPI003D258912
MDPTIAMAQVFGASQLSGADPATSGIHNIVGPSAEQIDKFQGLMGSQQDGSHAIVESHGAGASNAGNILSSAIESQDASMQQMMSDMNQFEQAAPTMSVQSMMAESGHMSMEIALTEANMQAKQGVVESSKSSLQTLMKNQ